MKKLLAVFSIVIAATYLQGCASGATVTGMTSSKANAAAKLRFPGNISVADAEGGKQTNPLWTSQVGSQEFEDALTGSLKNNGMLASGQGAYVLKPTLQRLQQPLFGMDFTVTADVLYVLKDAASGKDVMYETISSSHTATISDAVAGIKRLRLANEGAIRNNIDALLRRLAEIPAK
jgi:hypothetical protein